MELIETRSAFLYEESNFFQTSFLVQEGLIEPERFAPMFGIYGLAEAVNILMEKDGVKGQYQANSPALPLSYQISEQLADFVETTPVKYGYKNRAMLHAQSGISSDIGTTPGLVFHMVRSLILCRIFKPLHLITNTIYLGSVTF